ncbi:MFS transporter [Sinomonas halotolerans]|uniref:MFS transporter n=1 Tax=Sinomonas halotolerans TaxID=1644133 RepID=A0ABU9WWS9_9MICC
MPGSHGEDGSPPDTGRGGTATARLMAPPHRALVVGLLAIVTCGAFEAMAVTTAMPVVAAELGGRAYYGLAFSLFLTASMAATAAAGPWCDRRGPRPALLAGLALMCAGLVLGGAAGSFGLFTAGRMVSGLGMGFTIVAVYVVIGQALPQPLQPAMFGWFSAAWVVPSLIGPYASGLLAQHVSWRLPFLGVAPIVAAAFALVWPRVRSLPAPSAAPAGAGAGADGRRRALAGIGLAGGVAAAQWALMAGAGSGAAAAAEAGTGPAAQGMWSGNAQPVLIVVGLAGALAAVLGARRLIPPGVWTARRGLSAVMAVRGLLTFAFFGAEAFIPLLLVDRYGLEPSIAGLALTGGALGWTAGSFVQARAWLTRRASLVLGPAAVAACLALISASAALSAAAWWIPAAWVLAGMGMGLAMSVTSVATLDLSDAAERGRNSASLQLADMLGGVIGTAGAGTLYALMLDGSRTPGAFGFALLTSSLAVPALLGAVAGRRTDAPSRAGAGAPRA